MNPCAILWAIDYFYPKEPYDHVQPSTDLGPVLTALGAGGLASALALQDTLANLFSGITTIFSKQVRMGDYIKLASGEAGRVVDMNWRNTTIRTATGNMIIVPNRMYHFHSHYDHL